MKTNRINSAFLSTGKKIMIASLPLLFIIGCGGHYVGEAHKTEQEAMDIMLVADEKTVAATAEEAVADGEDITVAADSVVPQHNTEEYDAIVENHFQLVKTSPLSTFSIDVDNASYSNVRRFLNNHSMPPAGSVRIEELVNYFDYNYPQPEGKHPFSINTDVAQSPWNESNQLLRIGLQGKSISDEDLMPSNLVFLIDVSGSMSDQNKLPLLRKSFKLMVENLNPTDRVAIVVYAGASGVVLPSTAAENKSKILNTLTKLEAGGSTAGAEGIELAYKIAEENFIKNGNNRIILATDGDFNIGTSSTSELVKLIEKKRESGVYLSICGLGMGNYKDNRMEQLSNAGNGNYFYIDNIREANKVFVKNLRSNMYAIAKDVKIQIEFNPQYVQSYRLIGYENRMLATEDFNDDKKDAGELGAGHTVTALYEIVPVGSGNKTGSVDPLKFQKQVQTKAADSDDIAFVKFRYKPLDSDQSILIEQPIKSNVTEMDKSFSFVASLASFGMLLRGSQYAGNADYDMVKNLALPMSQQDEYTQEYLTLIKSAQLLSK